MNQVYHLKRWILPGLLSTSFATAAIPTVAVRSAPVYRLDGTLVNMSFVINLRDETGNVVTTTPFQGVISGPWGENGNLSGKPLKNGFLFLTGPGRYLPGNYHFEGLVGGQKVSQNIIVPNVKTKIQVQNGSLAAWLNSNETATKIWFQPTTPETKVNELLGWLIFEGDEQNTYRQYWHGSGGRAEFTVPSSMTNVRAWADLYQFNVSSLLAPPNDSLQPLIVRRIRSRWLSIRSLPTRTWWSVLDKD